MLVDCQATGARPPIAAPIELAWATLRGGRSAEMFQPETRVLCLPAGTTLPPVVARITGLDERMLAAGTEPVTAWCEFERAARTLSAARTGERPIAVAHFARFERPFLESLHARASTGEPFPVEIVCTHAIARRLLPELPRRSLRALAGYFGQGCSQLRRAADHVRATAHVWRALVAALEAEDVHTLVELRAWLDRGPVARGRRRSFPMARNTRLELPEGPGVYRLLRLGGDVLYVGKATSLKHRVNSHFRQCGGVRERALEMLTQARGIDFTTTETALEAALLECDEIKRLRPPYNVALLEHTRALAFAATDLGSHGARPDAHRVCGPFSSSEPLDAFAALVSVIDNGRASLDESRRIVGGPARRAPDETTFAAGLVRWLDEHQAIASGVGPSARRLVALGLVLDAQARRGAAPTAGPESPDQSDPGDGLRARVHTELSVVRALDTVVLRVARARRRGAWLARICECAVVFTDEQTRAAGHSRLLVFERGTITRAIAVAPGERPPVPPGWQRPPGRRLQDFTLGSWDRLRVLTTELRTLTTATHGEGTEICFGPHRMLGGERLARALAWV